MSSPILGIDLGTTNSVVAVADGTEVRALADELGRRLIPSTVSFHPDGSILVGHEARDRRLVDAENTVFSIKRLIGRPFQSAEVKRAAERLPFALEPTPTGGVQIKVRRGTYTLPEISAFVLRHVRTIAEQALGTACNRAVITVPANFNELQRSATQAAAKIAGLEAVRMINEPTAATLAYGLGKEGAERVLVYDLGGGTFDVTILDLDRDALEVVSTAGDTFLGGDDFDQLLADKMADSCLRQHRFDPRTDVQTFERLRAAAEWAKCQLSVVPEVELAVEELFHETGGRAVNFVFQAKRQEFEQLIRPLVARTFDVVNDALRACGRRPKEVDTVVLVGGSTRIPMIMEMVGEFFGRKPRFERDPDLVVAQGAALQAFSLGGRVEPPTGARPPVPRPMPPARAREALPKQPAFAPPEPSRTIKEPSRLAPLPTKEPSRTGIDPRPRTDAGLGPMAGSGTSPGIARPGTSPGTARPGTSPGLDEGTALARVSLKRTDDRPARAIDTGSEEPPLERLRHSHPGTTREPAAAVAVSKGVAVGATPPRPITLSELTQLDSVEAAPRQTGAHAPLEKKARKATMMGVTGALPVPGKLAADKPFDLPSRELDLAAFDEAPTRIGKAPEPPAPPTRPEPPRARTAEMGEMPMPPAPPPPPPPRAPEPPPSRPLSRTTGSMKRDISAWTSEPPSSPNIPLPVSPKAPSLPAFFPDLEEVGAPTPAANAVSGVPHQPSLAMPGGRAPLLMDVTPLALGIETVGGYCQHLVHRNAPVPTEKTRVFATGRDDQTSVEIRICQGDSNLFGENEALGVISLESLRRAKRGDVRIEVTFMLDASGVLDVRATDLDTKRAQVTRIQLKGGLGAGEVAAARARQERELAGRA